jgi:hypothetical protein
MHIYENFVKSEKQYLDQEGDSPKTRGICSPGAYVKYAMGPVTLETEQWAKKNFKGYKVPENWEAMEDKLSDLHSKGFKHTLQLDGSGFDLTQHQSLKDLIDIPIYETISKNNAVHSVGFLKTATMKERQVKLMQRKPDGSKYCFGSLTITGQTFSGNPDTTLMNTIRMAIYNMFVNSRVLEENDYELWVKGDDVVTFYKTEDDMLKAKKSYEKYFVDKSQAENTDSKGLGQVAKFYKMGDLTDIDFCSTNVIQKFEGTFKIIRKIENLASKQNHSIKAIKYNTLEMNYYNEQQKIAAQKWCKGDNMLLKYINTIHTNNSYLTCAGKMLTKFKEKIKLPMVLDDNHYLDRQQDYETELQNIERQSDKELSDDEIYHWLNTKDDPDLSRAWSFIQQTVLNYG